MLKTDLVTVDDAVNTFLTKLQSYEEAIAPLRMADRNLLKEATDLLHSMSPTHLVIAHVIESLMAIVYEEAVIRADDLIGDSNVPEKITSGTISLPKQYVCRECGSSFSSAKLKRTCPKCHSRKIKRIEST